MTGADETLAEGQGLCRVTASLVLKASPTAIELGAGDMAIMVALNAAHHINRHAPVDDFIAVALPGIRKGYGEPTPGFEIVAYGSPERLTALLECDGIRTLLRRGIITHPEILPCAIVEGTKGTAFVRDRREEKKSTGGRARQARRDAKRAAHIAQTAGQYAPVQPARPADFTSVVTLNYSTRPVFVRTVPGIYSGALTVSTFGLSGAAQMAVLPILLDAA